MIAVSRAERIKAGLPVAIIHALIFFALVRSLGLEIPLLQRDDTQLIEVPPSLPPPPKQLQAEHERSRRQEGAAGAPNLEARPTEVVAPPVVVPQPTPPVRAAPIAGPGDKPSSGAAPMPGPGTGAGGEGNGPGSGGFGNGPGGGGDDDGAAPPRQIRGELRDRDYPRGAGEAGEGGTVSVIYTVETDGRATHCAITHSSGSRELDDTTCRLIEQRFRFEPARDRYGRPRVSHIVQDHEWSIDNERRAEADDDEPQPPRRRRWPF
ncbi:MAG: TonB family protein [Sphingomonadaceae bacterium]|nr:TonB family protein [Sphingomonadaceae bacterium]